MKPATPKKRPAMPEITILQATSDPKLFGPHFEDQENWAAWRAFDCALFGLPMTDDELSIYRECTGRQDAPTEAAEEAWMVIGRRGGKSRRLGLLAVFMAVFRDWKPYLASGERGFVFVIAADRNQAKQILGYARGFLVDSPILAPLLTGDNAEELELSNGITISVMTASYRSIRGRTVVAALCDEAAFWRTDDSSANPDTEILAAIRPSMARVPGALLLVASSPYAKRGALWDAYTKHYGKDGRILVWKASTQRMNPTTRQDFIDKQYADDPARAAAEYGAEFRSDVGAFLDRTIIEAAVDRGVSGRPQVNVFRYIAFADPSGGRGDSFTLGIAHEAFDGTAVLDLLHEVKPPFDPYVVAIEVSVLLRSYGLTSVTGDRYAAEWVASAFANLGITYESSERDRSAIYLDVLPLFMSARVRLLDNPRLTTQFAGLERRTSSTGRDKVDHGPNGHDDLCNAAAGALVLAVGNKGGLAFGSISMNFQSRSSNFTQLR